MSGAGSFISHPMIKDGAVELRRYQETVIASASQKNSLVVMPTGLGKTVIAVGVAAHRLHNVPEGKILILAPTKPLVVQHKNSFEGMLETGKIDGDFHVFTGNVPPMERKSGWRDGKMFFATPQVVQNDLIAGALSLKDFSMVLFDEAHRSTGDYAYTFIAKRYAEEAKDKLVLGLTASPGGDAERIGVICGNLFIDNVEIRTEDDWDVKPYIQKKEANWVRLEFPDDFKKVQRHLQHAIDRRMKFLLSLKLIDSIKPGKKRLLRLQREVALRATRDRDPVMFQSMSVIAACIKLSHAKELLETQGISQLRAYLEKIRGEKQTKAVAGILADRDVKDAIASVEWLFEHEAEHPKLEKVAEILKKEMEGDKKAIVFTQYTHTVAKLVEKISEIETDGKKLRPVEFIGQRRGVTQKKQLETLELFRDGWHNVLCATCVAEEGLDIPNVDVVIFYEPIASEIRTIQRRGRTGRIKSGKVFVLITKDTIDEAYYWSSLHKEKKMANVLTAMRKSMRQPGVEVETKKTPQKTLKDVAEEKKKESDAKKPTIVTDIREAKILRHLSELDVLVKQEQLGVGDFLVSDRCCIERKEVNDFLESLMDGRLFEQARNLAANYQRPVMIIEGENLYGKRRIHPNAIRGALTSIALDFRIPILNSKNAEETSGLVAAIAKREQIDEERGVQRRGERKAQSISDFQEMIVSGFPDVNTKLSQRILTEFKTIKNFVNASEEELKQVEGVGKEKAKRIKDVLETEYKHGA